jgi:hypothetical protein
MLTRATLRALLTGLVLLAGCKDGQEPAAPEPHRTASSPDTERTNPRAPKLYDDRLAELAGRIPGFGGYHLDREGRLTVRLVAPTTERRSAARAVLMQVLSDRRFATGGKPFNLSDMRFAAAEYDFRQLRDYKNQVRPAVLGIRGVTLLDADEVRNRVVVGIESPAILGRVEAALATLGVPRGAVLVEEVETPTMSKRLTDSFQPLQGGVRIRRSPQNDYSCTLGFNVYQAGRGSGHHAVTNSHCTLYFGENDAQGFSQAGRVIGREIHDPAYFDMYTDANCAPEGFRCRYSDAALVDVGSTNLAGLGVIAQTTTRSRDSTSIEVSSASPTFRIRDNRLGEPAPNEVLEKVGSYSGWTWGYVTQTCSDMPTDQFTRGLHRVALLCQARVSGASRGGDSGSPVFARYGSTEVGLAGILWGGTATTFNYSPIDLVMMELDYFATS